MFGAVPDDVVTRGRLSLSLGVMNTKGQTGSGGGTFSLRLPSGRTLTLAAGARIGAHDLMGVGDGAFAETAANPKDPSVLGLKNLTRTAWSAEMPDGSLRQVEAQKSLRLADGTRIDFRFASGAVRHGAQGFELQLEKLATVPLQTGRRLSAADALGVASGSVAMEVVRNPNDPHVLGLKNLTALTWSATMPDGASRRVDAGRSLRLEPGTRIDFGGMSGEIAGQSLSAPPPPPPPLPRVTALRGVLASPIAMLQCLPTTMGRWFATAPQLPLWSPTIDRRNIFYASGVLLIVLVAVSCFFGEDLLVHYRRDRAIAALNLDHARDPTVQARAQEILNEVGWPQSDP
jgi:hypothetical protein